VTDLLRVAAALIFLLVKGPEDLWIAYGGSVVLSTLAAFFDGAKTSATANIVGSRGLLAGTALMFSSRFLLMALGSAFGGIAVAKFGHEVAFVINAASFLISAYSIWLIPDDATRESALNPAERDSFYSDMKEGVGFVFKVPLVLTIVMMNFIWAVGGGAVNIIAERLGGVYFAEREGWEPNMAVAIVMATSGAGLFLGTLIAHRVGTFLELNKLTKPFIGWTLIVHGVLFGIAGYMPSLWIAGLMFFLSRLIVGVEYAVQETMFQRALPDYIRGRISTLDRGLEITMFSISTFVSGLAFNLMSPPLITLISGIISATSGLVWFFRSRSGSHSPERAEAFAENEA
jgi:MFS family permease